MSDTPTPRTDAISPRHLYTQFVPADFARQLERELASITDTASMLASDLRAYQNEFMPNLEGELREWELLRSWGGTPAHVEAFIKSQQQRIHATQNVEMELAAANERIRRLTEALEFGVGRSRAMELMAGNHIGEVADMVEETKEVPCPDCYGGHFRPCNICGDSGVALFKTQAKESTP